MSHPFKYAVTWILHEYDDGNFKETTKQGRGANLLDDRIVDSFERDLRGYINPGIKQ